MCVYMCVLGCERECTYKYVLTACVRIYIYIYIYTCVCYDLFIPLACIHDDHHNAEKHLLASYSSSHLTVCVCV